MSNMTHMSECPKMVGTNKKKKHSSSFDVQKVPFYVFNVLWNDI